MAKANSESGNSAHIRLALSKIISEVDIAIGTAETTKITRAKLRAIRELLDKLRSDQLAGVKQQMLLTKREREILSLLSDSASLAEIAASLFISVTTLKSHTQAIYRKLEVTNRRAAIARASELGLLRNN
jgi:ATP/maltotriose-dependent transcriptional regulator MalT